MMRIEVLLVLGLVIGALGFVVERNSTTADVSNASENNSVHNVPLSTIKLVINIGEVTKSENIENNLKNNSDGITEKLLLSNLTFNYTNNIEISSPINDIDVTDADKKPKNIILVLIEGVDDENSWEKLKKNYSFAVEGFFQICETHKSDKTSKIGSTDDENCDCHKQLNSNISDLITFARAIKGMNTATVSESNSTTPTALGFDNLAHHLHHHHHDYYHHKSKLIRNIDNVANSSSISKLHPQSNNDPRSFHSDNQLASSMPTKIASSPPTNTHRSIEHHENHNRDRVWEFFNMITKIRLDFLKNIFDSMHESPIFNTSRDIKSRKQLLHFPVQQSPTLIELVTNTMTNLQTIPNENGFFMIVIAPQNGVSAIYKTIESQPSTKENLVIISGLDAGRDKKLIPYVANGPGANYFNNIHNVYELSSTIKLILEHCQGICKDEESLPPLSLLPVESFIPKIRVGRSEEDELADDEKPPEKEVTESEPIQEEPDDVGSEEEFEDKPKSSGMSFYLKRDSITLTFSIVISIIAAFILHT